MYPDLSYLFHDLFGTARDNWISIFKTFGLMLVLAILSSAYLLYIELKRRAADGQYKGKKVKFIVGKPASAMEIASNALLGFVLGYKLLYIFQDFEAFKADAAGVILSLTGNMLGGVLGAIAFGAYKWWEGNRQKLPKPKEKITTIYPHDRIGDITIVAAITGLLGAKIFAIIEDLPTFFADPIGVFFSGSGLAIYGGLVGGFLGVTYYLRRHDIPFWPTADAVAPALIMGYAVGRVGCQLSGDGDWGIVAAEQPDWWFLPDWLWSYDYPNNVINEGVPIEGCVGDYCRHLAEGVYPTPLYEIIMSVIIFAILWAFRKRLQPYTGAIFFLYLILNGIERFIIEEIRVNIQYDFLFNWTQAQIVAVAFMLIGAAGMFLRWRRVKVE